MGGRREEIGLVNWRVKGGTVHLRTSSRVSQ